MVELPSKVISVQQNDDVLKAGEKHMAFISLWREMADLCPFGSIVYCNIFVGLYMISNSSNTRKR